jgi:hypothetical protein
LHKVSLTVIRVLAVPDCLDLAGFDEDFPVVIPVVGLLAAASVTDDGLAFANRTLPQQDLAAVARPFGFDLVGQRRKWDKENRGSWGSARALTRQDLSRKQSPPPEEKNPN